MGQVDVGLGDAAHRGLQNLDLHLGVLELRQLLADGLDRAAHVGPENDVERLHLALLPEPLVEGFQGDVRLPAAQIALAGFGRPLLGQLPGLGDVVQHVEAVAGAGRGVQAGHVHRRGRAGLVVFLLRLRACRTSP